MPSRTRAVLVLSAGLLVAGLAGCAVPGESAGPGAAPRQSEAAPEVGQSESATPTPTASATPTTPPTAVAELSSLTGVRTQIALDPAFLETVTKAGLKATAAGNATLSDGQLTLPITGGSLRVFDADAAGRTTAVGAVAHTGAGLQLTGGNKRVVIRDLVIDPGSDPSVSATVSVNGTVQGRNVKVFRFDTSSLEAVKSSSGEVTLRGGTLSIRTEATGLLNDTFGAGEVTDDQQVGTVVVTAK